MSKTKKNSDSEQRIQDALAGLVDPDTLSAKEQDIFFDEFSDLMVKTNAKQEAFFAERRARGLGVGLDENDNLVYQSAENAKSLKN